MAPLVVFPSEATLCGDVFQSFPVPAMILVAIGSNLATANGATPYQSCNEAVEALSRLPGLSVTAVSRWYRSVPVPRSDQPDYLNGVVRLEAATGSDEPDPAVLLAALQEIEQAHGRVRSIADAARTLDLDIVTMGPAGGTIRDRPDPVLPHPRAHLRAFVLLPLREVAPDWVEPRSRLDLAHLVGRLAAADREPPAIQVMRPGET